MSATPDNPNPHRRYNPLRDSWVLISPHREQRPWQGQVESRPSEEPAFDPHCYLCPGNRRANDAINPDYEHIFVFDNDFPALLDEPHAAIEPSDSLFQQAAVSGKCRVICYSPRHDKRLGDLNTEGVLNVIECWTEQLRELSSSYAYVQIFENRGATMGCSNAHPHGQVWAMDQLPSEVALEDKQQRDYFATHGRPMLLDYALKEHAAGERTVASNRHWIAVVPWWASWPFETLVLPLQPASQLTELKTEQKRDLAQLLKQLLARYDGLFETPFPYSMGWHGAPCGASDPSWQLHGHFFPPLLRSATVRKHMVGFEMLGEPQRDLTPESAAQRLRDVQL